MQTTSTIFVVRPKHFGYNEETAANNAFQNEDAKLNENDVAKLVGIEFDNFVETLRAHGVKVLVYEDTDTPIKPDAIFPNNWISTHSDGSVITYPMFAPNRRAERREDILEDLKEKFHFDKRYSFEQYEEEAKFLEGTGSLIFDREHKICYACLSPRTDVSLVHKFSLLKMYKIIDFHAEDANSVPIYHTNVMMSVGKSVAVVCMDSIVEDEKRIRVQKYLEKTGKVIVDISMEQMLAFAGNMLEIHNEEGEQLMLLSDTAYRSLNPSQINLISEYCKIINVDIKTIEKIGGGSARCMVAEVFPKDS